jgi:hypothetical protein
MSLDFKKYSVKKSEAMTEQKAIAKAMEKLETFESNLERQDTETHYVFKKIRG